MATILILAGTYKQAELHAQRAGLKRRDWSYFYDPVQLKGCTNAVVHAVGTWRDRGNIRELMQEIKLRPCSFTEVKE